MEITLTPELEDLLNEQMQTGDYFSPTDILRESLFLLREMKKPRQVRQENLCCEIMKGVDAMREGNYRTYNSADEMMEDVIKEARVEFEAKNKNGKNMN